MFFSAIITMNNGDKFFLNGTWRSIGEAQDRIDERLVDTTMHCVNAKNELSIVVVKNIASIEIVDMNYMEKFRATIIENDRYKPENLFRVLKTIYEVE